MNSNWKKHEQHYGTCCMNTNTSRVYCKQEHLPLPDHLEGRWMFLTCHWTTSRTRVWEIFMVIQPNPPPWGRGETGSNYCPSHLVLAVLVTQWMSNELLLLFFSFSLSSPSFLLLLLLLLLLLFEAKGVQSSPEVFKKYGRLWMF